MNSLLMKQKPLSPNDSMEGIIKRFTKLLINISYDVRVYCCRRLKYNFTHEFLCVSLRWESRNQIIFKSGLLNF